MQNDSGDKYAVQTSHEIDLAPLIKAPANKPMSQDPVVRFETLGGLNVYNQGRDLPALNILKNTVNDSDITRVAKAVRKSRVGETRSDVARTRYANEMATPSMQGRSFGSHFGKK